MAKNAFKLKASGTYRMNGNAAIATDGTKFPWKQGDKRGQREACAAASECSARHTAILAQQAAADGKTLSTTEVVTGRHAEPAIDNGPVSLKPQPSGEPVNAYRLAAESEAGRSAGDAESRKRRDARVAHFNRLADAHDQKMAESQVVADYWSNPATIADIQAANSQLQKLQSDPSATSAAVRLAAHHLNMVSNTVLPPGAYREMAKAFAPPTANRTAGVSAPVETMVADAEDKGGAQ